MKKPSCRKYSRQHVRQRNSSACAVYESLKQSMTASATTPAEYEAACRLAAKLAGV